MLTDPIADFLTRIRNGLQAQKESVAMPHSSLKVEVARILKEQGYIDGYSVEPARVGQTITVQLKYTEDRRPAISGMERISRPGRRRYVSHDKVPRVLGGMGTAIVSTSNGVMSGHQARNTGVGGEVVAYVW
ncbi:MAG: small subunit ribosomal protein [Solirubrobacterales bacterium]|jgi:small subunit ribosomal protein S8|nr:small subunit ribosomal protein [Solirubrobacterales bacterium]MDX6653081.1 small subunit ribosomal protein [Solirubrobacterales bacterium]MDX6663765.1 small subunit ribosomal protein [Solirubrobacterales bacterium]